MVDQEETFLGCPCVYYNDRVSEPELFIQLTDGKTENRIDIKKAVDSRFISIKEGPFGHGCNVCIGIHSSRVRVFIKNKGELTQ